MRSSTIGSECDFLDNRWLWPSKAGAAICAIMSDRPTPAANSWRTRPSRPRVSSRSRASACDLSWPAVLLLTGHHAQAPAVLDHSRTLPQGDGRAGQVPTLWQGISPGSLERIVAITVQSPGALMPRNAISGLVCTTFLVLLGFSAVPQEPAAKGADTEAGQQTFNNACRTCHTTKEGDNRLGPNLHNIIGRKAGSLQNYGYSSAMKGADFLWDKEKLDRFIATPDEVVPGNNMKPYGGLTSAEDRAKVIVFLESLTTN